MSRFSLAALGAFLCLIIAGASGCAGSAHRPSLQSLGPGAFLEEAARHSAAAAELSREALTLADHEGVRAFAEWMAEDHSRIQREAVEALREIQADASPEADPAQKEVISSLTRHEGCRFEADYLACVVSDHEALIPAFEEQARSPAAQAAARSFAARNLPVLRKHLEEARALLEEVGGGVPRAPMPPPTIPSMRIGM